MNKSLFPRIIGAWLLVGTLDMTAATIQVCIKTKNNNPIPVFKAICKYIAGAVFGPSAKTGGNEMIVAGLVFHYTIALLFTVFFFILFSKLGVIIINRIVTGIVYGIFIWAVMNLIVVPLSAIGKFPSNVTNALIAAAILTVCIGIPLSLLAPAPGKTGSKLRFTEA